MNKISKRLKKYQLFICISLCVYLVGCSTIDKAHWELIEHPKKIVRYPSKTGELVGGIVGVPIAVVLVLPNAIICNVFPVDNETKAWAVFYPFIACYDIGTILFGGIPWLIFGQDNKSNPELGCTK